MRPGVRGADVWTEARAELRLGTVLHLVSFCQLASARVGTGDVVLITDDGCISLAPFPTGPGPFEVS
jgi:hypothetical protein